MKIYKHRSFSQWAKSERLEDKKLKEVIAELNDGLHDGNLGAGLYKKRVAMEGRSKRVSYRTLIAFRGDDKAFFLYGFSKNQKEDIKVKELTVFKELAKELLKIELIELQTLLKMGSLIEVK